MNGGPGEGFLARGSTPGAWEPAGYLAGPALLSNPSSSCPSHEGFPFWGTIQGQRTLLDAGLQLTWAHHGAPPGNGLVPKLGEEGRGDGRSFPHICDDSLACPRSDPNRLVCSPHCTGEAGIREVRLPRAPWGGPEAPLLSASVAPPAGSAGPDDPHGGRWVPPYSSLVPRACRYGTARRPGQPCDLCPPPSLPVICTWPLGRQNKPSDLATGNLSVPATSKGAAGRGGGGCFS